MALQATAQVQVRSAARALVFALLAAIVMLAVLAVPQRASATDPVTFGSSHVVDQSGALDASQQSAITARISKLTSDAGISLWVVFVPTFTNPSNGADWTNQVARNNGLGTTDYVFAIAVTGRQYYLSGNSGGSITFDQLDQIGQQSQHSLATSDWAGAVDAVAAGLTSATKSSSADSGNGSGNGAADGTPATAADPGGSLVATLIPILLIVAAGVIVWALVSRRRKVAVGSGPGAAPLEARQPGIPPTPAAPVLGAEFDPLPTAELARRASSALIAADEAIKTSGQELDFARAEFGDATTAEFVTALGHAHDSLDRAFALKQQLDDTVEDTEAETRAWNVQIIHLCRDAGKTLDDKAGAFEELRKLEQNAGAALAAAQEQCAAVASSMELAATRLQRLQTQYADGALATVADNITQATQRMTFADQQLATAQAAIAADDGGQAAVAIRTAEQAIGQAKVLQDAIERLGTDLVEGERKITALVQELRGDIAAARALPDPDGRVAAAVAGTQAQVDAVLADAASTSRHPLDTLHALQRANQRIDAVVASARDSATQAERGRQLLSQIVAQAQAQVSAAQDYISTRGGGVGVDARTRLAQATAELALAQQVPDVDEAMSHAQRAEHGAAEALQLAQRDVGDFGAGGMLGYGRRGGRGTDIVGGILGGILLGGLLDGGRGGGGFGGGGGGFGGGGGGFGGGFGGGGGDFGGGGFGGGGGGFGGGGDFGGGGGSF
jgi:uncharacterized membrane protein YgcG